MRHRKSRLLEKETVVSNLEKLSCSRINTHLLHQEKPIMLYTTTQALFQSCCTYWKTLETQLDRARRNNFEGSNGEICHTGRWPYCMGSDTRIWQGCVSPDTPPI